jgi:hypothetical protein
MREKVSEFANELLSLPQEIHDLQMEMINLNDESNEITEKIILRENEIKSEINAATDDTGKKVYSNEESRKIAFLNDSKSDSNLISLIQNRKHLDSKTQAIRAKIEMKGNLQRNLRSIMGVMAGSGVEV